MNVKRFTARTSRDALALVRQAFGDDAVVLSTKPCAEGVEVLAMAPEGMAQIEKMATTAPRVMASDPGPVSVMPGMPETRPAQPQQASLARRLLGRALPQRTEPVLTPTPVEQDVEELSMSTLSFQDYVRERMLKRRQEALAAEGAAQRATVPMPAQPERGSVLEQRMSEGHIALPITAPAQAPVAAVTAAPARQIPVLRDTPVLHDSVPHEPEPMPAASAAPATAAQSRRDQEDMMNELRQVKGLIEERFGALAFMEKLQRQPKQAQLTQKLLDCGFSPALIRKISESLPLDVGDESAWAASVLERNVLTGEHEGAIEDQGGVYALVGATGVGKTTSTAKIAAAFAAKYGAANLGLITLDAYRVGAHEQLRAYGRILGVPVHTAHDRASLEDLLELLAAKKMVLIDTAGMAQRDSRTRELLDMLSHRSIRRLLVINAAAQGETIEDVMISYRAATCAGIVLSKMDEAVKLGPALDALIRHKLKVIGVANGQRVPEDWHRLSANALVHRALRGGGSAAYKLDAGDVSLVFAGTSFHGTPARAALHA